MKRLTALLIFLSDILGGSAYPQSTWVPPVIVRNISAGKIEIVDDAFVNRVLDNELTFLKLKKIYSESSVKRDPLVRAPLHAKKSAFISFTSGKDSLKFIDNTSSVNPVYLSLYTPKVILDSQLKIGVSKNYFLKRYKLEKVPDHIFISETEGGCSFQFIFVNNQLCNIRYTLFLD